MTEAHERQVTSVGKKILTINLGTTSTRLSLYDEATQLSEKKMDHSEQELAALTQKEHVETRGKLLLDWMAECNVRMQDIDAIALRIANLPKSIISGTVLVNDALRADLTSRFLPDKPLKHGTDITIALADMVCQAYQIPYYVVDPANQNNMIDEAKISGHPLFERNTIFHALNQKSVAHLQAEALGKKYSECNFIIAHMGGGISVAAHQQGRITDTTNCSGEDGAFSGTRTGTLPARQLVQLCYSGTYTFEQMLGTLLWKGGVSAYLGTSDMREVEARIAAGDQKAALIFRTVAYRTAKEIGALCAVIEGNLDGIILTGGMANSPKMCELITHWVNRFAPISIYAGERESEALANGVLRILNNEDSLAVYPD